MHAVCGVSRQDDFVIVDLADCSGEGSVSRIGFTVAGVACIQVGEVQGFSGECIRCGSVFVELRYQDL